MNELQVAFSEFDIKQEEDLTDLTIKGNYALSVIEWDEEDGEDFCGNDVEESDEIAEGTEIKKIILDLKEAPYVTPFLSENLLMADTFFKHELDLVELEDYDTSISMDWSIFWPSVRLLSSGEGSNQALSVLLDPAADNPKSDYLSRGFFVLGSGAETDFLNGKLIDAEDALERQMKFESEMSVIHCAICDRPAPIPDDELYSSIISSYGIPCGPDPSAKDIERSIDWTILNAAFFADQVKGYDLEDGTVPMFMLYGHLPEHYLFCLENILSYIDAIEHPFPMSDSFYLFPYFWIGLGGFEDITKPLEYVRLIDAIKAITPVLRERKQIMGVFIKGLSSVPAWSSINHYIRCRMDDQRLHLSFDEPISRNRQGVYLLGSKPFESKEQRNRHEAALALSQYRDNCYYRGGGFFDPFSIAEKQ